MFQDTTGLSDIEVSDHQQAFEAVNEAERGLNVSFTGNYHGQVGNWHVFYAKEEHIQINGGSVADFFSVRAAY